MAEKVETSRPDGDLTDSNPVQESTEGSTEPTTDKGGSGELGDAKNFQHALQKSREREKAAMERAEQLDAQIKKYKDSEKQKKMAEMNEADRYRAIAEEEMSKRGKLELRQLVSDALESKKIPAPIREMLITTPWAIPAVQADIGGSDFTWDEAIDSVKRHLPDYVDSLVADESPTIAEEDDTESTDEVDAERTVEAGVVKRHVYTRQEIDRISKDPKQWEKHGDAILAQIAKDGGTLSR